MYSTVWYVCTTQYYVLLPKVFVIVLIFKKIIIKKNNIMTDPSSSLFLVDLGLIKYLNWTSLKHNPEPPAAPLQPNNGRRTFL